MGSASPTFQRARFDATLDHGDSHANPIRCISDLIHFNAIYNPQHIFCIQSRQASKPKEGIESVKVTFSELAQSIERCCSWILLNVAGTQQAQLTADGIVRKSPPVALFLESDLTLFIYLTALLTLNIPCLLLSIRLSSHAIRHLLRDTKCASILVSVRTSSSINGDLDESGVSGPEAYVKVVPSFETFLSSSRSDSTYLSRLIDCKQTVREDDRNVLILHSSGTTGLPKAIFVAHRYLLGYAKCHEFPVDQDLSIGGYNLSTLPLFHGFGILAPSLALSVGKRVWFPPSTAIPTANLVISLLKRGNGDITSLMTVPTILEDITLMHDFDAEAATELSKLNFVAVGGGGMKTSVGRKLHSKGVTLLNHFGATELGALAPIFQPDEDYDWTYLRLRTDFRLKLKVLESPDCQPRIYKLIGYPFGWNAKFELQDRLEVNPLKPDLEVRILGRNDDVIVLATGEKVSPHVLEHNLEQHPLVRRAVVFGDGQFETGLLVEPVSHGSESAETFIDTIWPHVLALNTLMDHHARISSKATILIKPAKKQIPLTDKGSIRRKELYDVFESEISALYSQLAQVDANISVTPFDSQNPRESLREIAQSCLPEYNKSDTWSDESDFVALGMDSLQATRFRRTLRASLRLSDNVISATSDLPLDIIYSHPSISSLAEAVNKWLRGTVLGSIRTERMTDLVNKFAYKSDTKICEGKTNVILITGSTGNLGANLLHILSEDYRFDQIICLIRSSLKLTTKPSQEELVIRQRKAFEDRGIIVSASAWSKVEFLPWLPGLANFGLTENEFRDLALRITHIFHGAWPMDFKMKVQSFEPHVKVVRELIELGRRAHILRPHVRPKVVLASSIAVVGCYSSDASFSLVPEIPMDDPKVPLPIGYAEAKWVCEKVMESAYDHLCEVEPIIIRIGQLSGSTSTGFWSSKEHFPALIKASQTIGAMPDLQGSLSWIPVDRAAHVVKDILLQSQPQVLVYHLENPIRQSWPNMCTIIERKMFLTSARRLSFQEWLNRVPATKENSNDLMDFFKQHFLHMSSGCLVLDTSKARKVSPTLRSTGAISIEAIDSYLAFWKHIGFLDSIRLNQKF